MSEIIINKGQFDLIIIKVNEVIESNVLVAATNIANDLSIDLDQAILKALDAMDTIREMKRDRRSNNLKVVV